MDAWSYANLAVIGLAVLMITYEFGKWLFKRKEVEFSTLAKLIISELSYPPNTMSFKGGWLSPIISSRPDNCDKDEIITLHGVLIKKVGFWGCINCFFQGINITSNLTKAELKIIYKDYAVAIKNKYAYDEKIKNKIYETTLALSQNGYWENFGG